ncbi:3-oxoacyl-ACP reductase [Jonesia quinghaiensis]|uniref:3-oxoacyl-ACP reductase n=1 Tax=Jonesia quinghaiensis TaxID=262806 RepID=UPI000414E82C|nr:3-oxoacyl-ACP reductase [Jonesia quinghaiensis]
MPQDRYTSFVKSGFGKKLAKKLGLPQPVQLRRHTPGAPPVTGPVLVLSAGAGNAAGTGGTGSAASDADAVAGLLLNGLGSDETIDVRRSPHTAEGTRWGAVIVVTTQAEHPRDLSDAMLALGGTLRALASSGRVVFVSRDAADASSPAQAAVRQGVVSAMRSVAKELRNGATANALVLRDDATVTGTPALAALRFLLSAKSAFVDGQPVTISSDTGHVPQDWEKPLAGKVAVVTGAAQGIGASIAATLARDGARVVAVDVPAAGESLSKVANKISGTALQLDITSPDAGKRIIDHAVERHGGIDIVIHNAGITRDKLLANMDNARWDSVIDVNISAQLAMNEQFLASDRFRDAPRIVSLASTSGIAGNRGQTNYGASKGGVIGMVAASARALAEHGGTINAVAPGFIETAMTTKIPLATREVARRLNALQQGGQPVDVAETIAFLASPATGGINGEVVRVCGQNMVGA